MATAARVEGVGIYAAVVVVATATIRITLTSGLSDPCSVRLDIASCRGR